ATITRAEFIGGEFFYAVRVDASRGFELCPADGCAMDDTFCPAGEEPRPQFEIVRGFHHPILRQYRRFLADNGIEVAGIEFIADEAGEIYTYDVNTNTNYNPDAEARAGRSGMGRIADFLGAELARLDGADFLHRSIA
ncbi:MAG: alpha-L-glutamate ligase, partial [SAR324 cluster bacterium]|nr:alpha-L-glutamate ligase [SAR324 cluster bacterium]